MPSFLLIETKRLLLKGLTPQGMKDIFDTLSKEKIKKVLGHQSEEEYQKEEYKSRNGYATYNRTFLLFLMEDKASGKIVGRCGLHNWNPEHRRAEIGYQIKMEEFKRKGLMSEAVEAIIEHGFKKLDLHRIEAMTGPANTASLRILEKNGFVKEGVLRQHYLENGKHDDSLMFSLLREEYLK